MDQPNPPGRAHALRSMRAWSGLWRIATALGLLFAVASHVGAQANESVIFVVRHAERAEDGTNDPPLSVAGNERAELIAGIMADARLTHLYSTDFLRTQSTIRPTARATGLPVASYDPRDLAAFAEQLRSTPGRHLVVGHSNTSPALVEAIGGEPGEPIEEMEYDRFYVVVVRPGGDVGTAVFRFGRR